MSVHGKRTPPPGSASPGRRTAAVTRKGGRPHPHSVAGPTDRQVTDALASRSRGSGSRPPHAMALVANVQGAAAPFASLLPMLTGGGADSRLDATLTQVRQQLSDCPGGQHSPALAVMVDDFALYHAVLAAMAVLVALVLLAVCVVLWRRLKATSDAGSRRAVKAGITGSAVLAAVVLVIAFENVTSAADSPRALADFFNGAW